MFFRLELPLAWPAEGATERRQAEIFSTWARGRERGLGWAAATWLRPWYLSALAPLRARVHRGAVLRVGKTTLCTHVQVPELRSHDISFCNRVLKHELSSSNSQSCGALQQLGIWKV